MAFSAANEECSRTQLILKLIATNHLNVPERRLLRAAGIKFSEALTAINAVLEKDGQIVSGRRQLARPGNGIYRITWIVDPNDCIFSLSVQDAMARAPYPCETRAADFGNLSEAVSAFLDQVINDFDGVGAMRNIPGTIEGIPIHGLPGLSTSK